MSEVTARIPSREDGRADLPLQAEPSARQAASEKAPAKQATKDEGARLDDGRPTRRRWRVLPIIVTLCVAGIAAVACWLLWQTYMASPWTRDGTVRVYVVTMAPEVAGSVVELPVRDNQFVHKGDLLMKIDPRDYRVAMELSQAAVDQAEADFQNKQSQAARRLQLTDLATTPEQKEQYVSTARMAQATIEQQKANLDRAKINLERTEIRSPVNGWVTNLLLQQGDYANTGQTSLSLVNADSYWVDGYFEETTIAPIREGDPARIWLLGYRQVIDGHVDSIARGIVVSNATPGQSGLATVNPIFTWVRLAQRVPVRVRIDHVPPDVRLVAGMTATVEIDPGPAAEGRPVAGQGTSPGAGAPNGGQPGASRSGPTGLTPSPH